MKTKNTPLQNVLEILGGLLCLGTLLYFFLQWSSLPDQVPVHYNFAGEIDRWGSKNELLLLPIVSLVLYLVITAVSFFPQSWNMLVTPTPETAPVLYRNMKTMLLTLKVETTLLFFYLIYSTISTTPLFPLFTPLIFLGLGVTLFVSIYGQRKIDRAAKRMLSVDLEVARLKHTFPVSRFWLLIPLVLTGILCVFPFTVEGKGTWPLALLSLAEVLPFCLLARLCARGKSRFFCDDEEKNLALNRLAVRKQSQLYVFLAYNASLCGFFAFLWTGTGGTLFSPPVIAVYCAHVVLAVVIALSLQRHLRLTIARIQENTASDT